jgi:hypothetical protein
VELNGAVGKSHDRHVLGGTKWRHGKDQKALSNNRYEEWIRHGKR